ncbi:MAG TPA: SRPBCC family protein [Kribbella sp.]|nr:SRPBCC family protein [Kribbella sp.]
MKLEHKFVVPAPVEETWAAFNDLERVVPCFPGAALTSYEGDEFTGTCKVKLGPVSLQYSGTGTFVERDESTRSAVIEAKGKDRRGNGTATAHVTTRLTGTSDNTTEVTVDTELTITGRPAQFGRGLIQDVSNKLLDQFTACLKTKLQTTEASADGDTSPAGAGEGAGAGTEQAVPDAASTADADEVTPARSGSRDGSAEDEPAALDLGGTLLPMLAKRAVPYLIGAVLALLLRRLIRR